MKIIILLLLVTVTGLELEKTYAMKTQISEKLDLFKSQDIDLFESQDITDSTFENLLIKFNEVTVLEAVTVVERTLEKQYRISSLQELDLDIETFSNQIEKSLINQSCRNNQSTHRLNNGISEKYIFNDKNDQHVLTIKVSVEDC